MSSAIPGFRGLIHAAEGGVATMTLLGEAQSITVTESQNLLDATSHDSDGWKDSIGGLKSVAVSVSALSVPSDTAQALLLGIINASGTETDFASFKIYPDSSDTGAYWSGDGRIKSFKQDMPLENPEVVTFEIESVGEWTPPS
jgi:predicted secreted protein